MQKRRFYLSCSTWSRISVFLLSFVFCIGLCAGVYTAYASGDDLFPSIAAVVASPLSISGLIFVLILPVLLSALLIYLSLPSAILPICFFKAFCFGYCSCGVLLFFESAGWLIRFFLLFSGCCMMVPYLWFSLRHINGTVRFLKRDLLSCVFFAIFFGSLDYYLVSPYLMMLVNS